MSINRPIVLFLTVFVTACGSGADAPPDPPPGDPPAVVEFEGEGRLRNVIPTGDYAIVEHGPIEGLMGAMTMPFLVRAEGWTDEVSVGDSVRFGLRATSDSVWVFRIDRVDD